MSHRRHAIPYGPILNLYPDSLGGNLSNVADFLELSVMEGVFSSLYILPSLFHSDLDRGFSIIDYALNEELAAVEDLDRIKKKKISLILDFVINHLSTGSIQFLDVLQKGNLSAYRDFFIDWNKFWLDHGEMNCQGYIMPKPEFLSEMYLRKPGLPILMVLFPDGCRVPYWNTFYQQVVFPTLCTADLVEKLHLSDADANILVDKINKAISEHKNPIDEIPQQYAAYSQAIDDLLGSSCKYLGQMDLNIDSDLVWAFYHETLRILSSYGASIIRLDAFAYASKEVGSRNFLNEPGTWDLLREVSLIADIYKLNLLPEIHTSYSESVYEKISDAGYLCYDFFLPGLILDALEHGSGEYLIHWADELHRKKIRVVNMLGCHDGIPLLDLRGLLPDSRISALIDLIVSRGGIVKNLHGQKEVYYQVNSTYFSALGEDNNKLLLSRALQLFMPGIPQIWYLDLFAGRNDFDAIVRHDPSGHKEINRTNLSAEQVIESLEMPVVRAQIKLIRFRQQFRAFHPDASFVAEELSIGLLRFVWKYEKYTAFLEVDLKAGSFLMLGKDTSGQESFRFSHL